MYTKSTKIAQQFKKKKKAVQYFDLPCVWRKPKLIQCSYYPYSMSADAVLHTTEKVEHMNIGSEIL